MAKQQQPQNKESRPALTEFQARLQALLESRVETAQEYFAASGQPPAELLTQRSNIEAELALLPAAIRLAAEDAERQKLEVLAAEARAAEEQADQLKARFDALDKRRREISDELNRMIRASAKSRRNQPATERQIGVSDRGDLEAERARVQTELADIRSQVSELRSLAGRIAERFADAGAVWREPDSWRLLIKQAGAAAEAEALARIRGE